MKKILILISLVVCCLVCSCKKESSIKPYTERQEAAMRILSGTFIYQNSSVDWLKTTYIFGQQYQEPKKVKNEDGETTILHGEVRLIYYNGDTYDEYYWLSSNANEIFFYRKSGNYFGEYYKISDCCYIEFLSESSFQMKSVTYSSWSWEIYKKQY